jgi:PAT family beta-lactamase induction signal transducer AmpG
MSKIFNVYLDKRMLFIFLNGIASGFPWVIIGSAMTLWLKDSGLSRTGIGFFGLVFAVYSVNWMWAPLLDRVKIPWLFKRFGQRRSWLLLLQSLLLILIVLMSFVNPETHLAWLSVLALGVAIVSSTQDIVIDAYRIDVVNSNEQEKLPATAAMSSSGWWAGYSFLGAFALYLSDFGSNWNQVYFILSLCVVGFILNTLWLFEPKNQREVVQARAEQDYEKLLNGRRTNTWALWILVTMVEPIKDFFTRFGMAAIGLLFFIMFFKIGESFLGKMSLLFYKEIGFSTADIATYSKLVGGTLTIVFSIVASFITVHYGLIRGLLISGVAMASTNLIFAYMAITGADTQVFAVAILFDNFTSAFSTVAFVAFISQLTNRAYTATQYALMASAGNLGRTLFASSSGLLVDSLGRQTWTDSLGGEWSVFFVITALMVIPSLVALLWLGKRFRTLLNL